MTWSEKSSQEWLRHDTLWDRLFVTENDQYKHLLGYARGIKRYLRNLDKITHHRAFKDHPCINKGEFADAQKNDTSLAKNRINTLKPGSKQWGDRSRMNSRLVTKVQALISGSIHTMPNCHLTNHLVAPVRTSKGRHWLPATASSPKPAQRRATQHRVPKTLPSAVLWEIQPLPLRSPEIAMDNHHISLALDTIAMVHIHHKSPAPE